MTYYQPIKRLDNPGVITLDQFKLDSHFNGSWDEKLFETRDTLYYCRLGEWGAITVLQRRTGFGYVDIETGYSDHQSPWSHVSANFWLASGMVDIREYIQMFGDAGLPIKDAIAYIKERANTCVGKESHLYFEKSEQTQREYMKDWPYFLLGTNSPNQRNEYD